MKGYCMKCKEKTEMKDITSTETKRGTMMNKGTCVVCGCKMCCISKKE